jgi:hypothetical protein
MNKDNQESKELSLNKNIDFYYQGALYKSWIIFVCSWPLLAAS